MPPPARLGDTSAHGGVTAVGDATTMIARQPIGEQEHVDAGKREPPDRKPKARTDR